MVNLNEVLSLVLNDLSRARAIADLESVNIAEAYAADKRLKNFAVPRMRLKNVQVSIPIAIDKIDEKKIKELRKPLSLKEVQNSTSKIISNIVKDQNFKLTRTETRKLNNSMAKKLSDLQRTRAHLFGNYKVLSEELGEELESSLSKTDFYLKKRIKETDFKKLIERSKTDLRIEFYNQRESRPSIEVVVNTSQLRELAPTEKLTNLNLTISEEGMEWAISESEEGKIEENLVPE